MTSAAPTMSFEGMPSEGMSADGIVPVAAGAEEGPGLPSFGSGERRTRRQQRKRRQRRRTLGALAATVVLAGSAIALVGIGGDALWDKVDQQDDARRQAEEGAAAGEAPVAVTTRLVVHESDDGSVTGLTVFVPEADRRGGSVLFVPVGSMVEVPSFGLEPVGRAHELGGLPLLQQSVENLLGIRFSEVVVLGPDEISALVESIGSLTLEIPERVEDVDRRGRVRVLFEKGPAEIGPDGVQLLLDARGQSTDLGRLVRHQAFWSAWLAAVSDAVEGGDTLEIAGVSGILDTALSLSAGSVRFDVVPVSALSTGGSDDGDLYQVDRQALRVLLDRVVPHATTAAADARIEVQLLNGTGEPGLAQQITPLLVAAGAEVKLVGNADRFDYEETQIVYYDQDRRAAAEAIHEALDAGEVVFSRQGLDVVDVTVVVGTDLSGGEAPDDGRE